MMWSREFARKFVSVTAKGAAATLGGTTISCIMAIYIEGAANRTLFRYFPQWFAKLDYVPFGLDPNMVEAVQKHYRYEHQVVRPNSTTTNESILLHTDEMMELPSFGEAKMSDSHSFHVNLWQHEPSYDGHGSFLSQRMPSQEQKSSVVGSFWWREQDSFLSRHNILACAMTG